MFRNTEDFFKTLLNLTLLSVHKRQMKFDYEKPFSGTRVRCHFVLLCTANNLCVFLTRTHTLKSHGRPSAALACCFTSTLPVSTSTPPPAEEAEEKNFSECDGREWYLSLLLFFFRLFHALAFRLNSVSNGSINKVFRKRAVCSPFPGPSEWLSVSAAGRAAHARTHAQAHTHTPGISRWAQPKLDPGPL